MFRGLRQEARDGGLVGVPLEGGGCLLGRDGIEQAWSPRMAEHSCHPGKHAFDLYGEQ